MITCLFFWKQAVGSEDRTDSQSQSVLSFSCVIAITISSVMSCRDRLHADPDQLKSSQTED